MNYPLVIALGGYSESGKSSSGRYFSTRGFARVKIATLYKKIYEKVDTDLSFLKQQNISLVRYPPCEDTRPPPRSQVKYGMAWRYFSQDTFAIPGPQLEQLLSHPQLPLLPLVHTRILVRRV